jgi:hypothetical protein
MSHKVSSLTFGILRSSAELRFWLPHRVTVSDPVALGEKRPCLSRYDTVESACSRDLHGVAQPITGADHPSSLG